MSNKTGDWHQGFWEGKISRKEAQKAFDEIGSAVNSLHASMSAYNLTMAYVMVKIGATEAEFQEFVKVKIAEMQTAAEAQQVADDASKPSIVTLSE